MLTRVWMPSPNYSGRGGSPVRLIVLHTAEGALTYQSLGNYFASAASGVSSHVGIDDTAGTVGEYVRPDGKAWTQGNANPYCVAAELCAFAAWTPADWAAHPQMLANAAQWVAEEAQRFGIPLVVLSETQAQDGHSRGVCQHADLGAAGGGHWDCGPGFPIHDVVAMAAGQPPTEEDDLTPEQASQLAATLDLSQKLYNLNLHGTAEAGTDQTAIVWDHLLHGWDDPNAGHGLFGALLTLDQLLRDVITRIDALEARQ